MTNRTWITAARAGVLIGVLAIVSAIAVIVAHPGQKDTPTCDGRPMLKTDLCIEHASDGSAERRTYDDMKGHFQPLAAGVLLGGGVVLIAAAVGVTRRRRASVVEAAPSSGTEVAAEGDVAVQDEVTAKTEAAAKD